MLTTTWTTSPQFAPSDYRTTILQPTVQEVHGQRWLYTPETLLADHPWADLSADLAFPNPTTHTYYLIAVQHNIHPTNGNIAWDLEAYCPQTNSYLTMSYAENS